MKKNQTLIALVGGFMCLAPACDSGAPSDEGAGDEGTGVPNDPTDDGSDSGDDSGTDTDTDTGTDEAAMIQVHGYIGEWLEGYPPLAGVTVRIVDHDEIPPVVTDESGTYLFPEVPAGEDIIVFAEGGEDRESAASRVFTLPDTDHQIWPMFLFDKGYTVYGAQQLGITYDESLGRVVGGVWRVTDDVLVGAGVNLSPESGTRVYGGDPEATAIQEDGIFVFWNVDIGEYEVSASHPDGGNCWAAGPHNPESPRVRTFPGTATFSMGFTCD